MYRPPIGEHMSDMAIQDAANASASASNTASNAGAASAAAVTSFGSEDPPPKYTPPPSYTTATGARIAKFVRQSIRRSVRRLANVLGESSNSGNRQRAAITPGGLVDPAPPPPDYNTVLVEMNQTSLTAAAAAPPTPQTIPDVVVVHSTPNRTNIGRLSTLERLRALQPNPGAATLTAAEVASILRSSFRRSTVRSTATNNVRNMSFTDNGNASLSAENLVESAAPISETSLVLGHLSSGATDVEIKSD